MFIWQGAHVNGAQHSASKAMYHSSWPDFSLVRSVQPMHKPQSKQHAMHSSAESHAMPSVSFPVLYLRHAEPYTQGAQDTACITPMQPSFEIWSHGHNAHFGTF